MIDPLQRVTGLSGDEFAAAHWGVAPLFRRAAQLPGGDFSSLLSLDGVDEILSRRGLRTPFLRMTKNGDVIPPARYTRGGGAGAEIGDQVADDRVLALFAAGATIVLQGLHRLWPPIIAFASEFSAQLGHPVQVNAYITPPRSQALSPHYDVHDVFMLHFAGRKHWRIHEPVWPLPLRDQPWQRHRAAVAAQALETPLIDAVIEPGDAVYLPRGFLHSATSLDDVSGHLTIGIHPVTRSHVADHVFSALANDVELRKSLPSGTDLGDARVLDAELDATIAAMQAALERVDRAAVARAIGRHLAVSSRPAPLRPLSQASIVATLTAGTLVRLRPGLRAWMRSEEGCVVVELADRDVRLDTGFTEAVRSIISGSAVCAERLGIPVDEGLSLVAQLLREGVVVPA